MSETQLSRLKPDNGRLFYAWLIWLLAANFLFYKYILEVSPSVMVPELMHAFNLNGQAVGDITAFYFYTYLLMQLPAGLLLDYLSPRHLISAAILLCAVGTILFAKASNIFIAEASRLLIGMGAAFAAVGPMKIISEWFDSRNFALVAGLMIAVGMLGAVGGQAPIAAAVNHWGWRETLLILGVIGLVYTLIFWLIVRDKPKTIMQNRYPFVSALLDIIKQKQSWLISLYSGLVFAPISAFAGLWGIPYLMQAYDISRTSIASLMSLVFIGFAIGSPLSGWLSDKMQRRKPCLWLGAILPLIFLTCIIYLPMNLSWLAISLSLYGLFTGFFFASFAAIREINDTRVTATAMGFINTFNAIGGALSAPLIGKLLDMNWQDHIANGIRVFSLHNYHFALLTLPLYLIVAVILLFFIQETYRVESN